MPDQKVLITGATGLLGRAILHAFQTPPTSTTWTAIGTGLTRASPPSILKLDLTDPAALAAVLDATNPTAIIHAAAERRPDAVASAPAAAYALNEGATRALATHCAARGIVLLYVSTDYVFGGARGEAPYAAGAATAPGTAYGASKAAGERAVLDKEGGGVVLRVPVLYGEVQAPEESAVNVLMEVVRRGAVERAEGGGKGVAMDAWAVRYPTHTADVARVCVDVVQRYVQAAARKEVLPRVLQFTAEQALTKFAMCEIFAGILGVSLDGVVWPNREGNDPSGGGVQRPYDCHLRTDALQELGIDVHAQDFEAWWRWKEGAFRH